MCRRPRPAWSDSQSFPAPSPQDFLLKGAYWVPLRIEESTGECEFIIVPKEVGGNDCFPAGGR